MHLIRWFLTVLLLLHAAAAYAQEDAAPADLSLFVFDGDLPAQGVGVEVDGRPQARTNRNGAAWLLLPAGERSLTLYRADGRTTDIQLDVAPGENMRVIATLPKAPTGGQPVVDVQSSKGSDAMTSMQAVDPEDPTGTLRGRVASAQDGGPVASARVFVSGTPVDVKTDDQGQFEAELPAGTYAISVIHGDYSTQTKDGVTVAADETTQTRVELTPAGLELQDYVVTVPHIEGSVAGAIAKQGEASGVTEVLGADQMSRSGDSDAADALARVTGLTIEDGKYVVIRGQPSRYTSTVLNGSPLPSPDPMRRIVPLDLFPTGVLSAIEVQKSYTADRPGTFGAGLIDLQTRGLPESAFAEIEVGTGINSQSFGEDGLTYEGGGTDWLGVDDGAREGPESGIEPPTAQEFGNHDHEISREKLGPDRSVSASAGGGLSTPLGDYGAVASFSYDQEWRYRQEERTFYSLGGGELQENENYTVERTDMEVGLGGMLTLGGQWGENQSITSNTFLMRKTRDRAEIKDGQLSAEFDRSQEYRLSFLRRELLLQQFVGEHTLFWDIGLDWRVLAGRAERELPDRRTYTYNFLDQEAFLREDVGMERQFNTVEDDVFASDAGLTVPLGQFGWLTDMEAKVGMASSSKDRSSQTDTFSFLPTSQADLTNPPNQIFDPERFGESFEIRDDTQESDSYTGLVDIAGQYVMLDLELLEALELNLGLRQEEVTMEVNPGGEDPASGFTEQRSLPGASATWKFYEGMKLRLAYSETYSLPMLSEIAPVTYTDPDTGEPYQGNPDLRPADITAYDVRWEWYPSEAEMLTLAWFRKDYDNPIERSFADLAGGDRTLNQMRNFSSAEVTGYEVGARMDLAQRLGGLEGTYLQANASFVDSEIDAEDAGIATSESRPLQGQAPWVYNIQAGYAGEAWDFTLSLNMVGERLYQAGVQDLPDIYQEPVEYLDAAAGFRFADHWSLNLKAGNLLNPTIEYTQGGELYRTYQKGRDFSLSLGWEY